MLDVLQSLRYALRALANQPVYAGISIAVLAIAIGANATVFSVLNAFLLRPLPYPDGDRLVLVYDSYPKIGVEIAGTSIPDYVERRAQASSLEELAIFSPRPRTLTGEGPPEQAAVARTSPSFFDVLGVRPALGRVFDESEASLGNDRVAVLSHRLWTTRFGSRPDIVGRDLRLDGETFRVIGVMPEGFSFGGPVAAWVPFAFTPQQLSDAERGIQYSIAVGRLRQDATLEGLNAELDAIVQRNVAAGVIGRDAIDTAGFTGRAQYLRDFQVGSLEPMLLTLQATVLAVLLIACANVASLQLGRSTARRKELAIRAALGAGSRSIMRLVLIESLVLALAGAVAGLAFAAAGLELVRVLGLERAGAGFAFELDVSVLVFTLGAAVFAALISGLPPVLALLRDDLTRAVQEAGRLSAGGRRTHALRNALVVVQIGMSVALLAGAGSLTKSFIALQQEGPGFVASGLWTAQFSLPRNRYAEPVAWSAFQDQALAALRALPGVTAAGFTASLPFTGDNNQGSIDVEGYVAPPGAAAPHAQSWTVSDGYFAALGMPLLAGRDFAPSEGDRVAIVDQNLASRYWPDGNALGQRVRLALDEPGEWYTVIGVVPPVKPASLAQDSSKETVYWHYRQRPVSSGALAARTVLPPAEISRAATAAVAALDPELAVFDVQPMDARIATSLGPQRAPMVLSLVFAAVAFTLAVIGIYGVLNWAVTQRVGEIGVRVALGARTNDIVRMIVTQGGRLIAIGTALGIAGAIALGAVLAAQIGNLRIVEPAVLAAAVAALASAALLASWVPARRASRIDPMRALRDE